MDGFQMKRVKMERRMPKHLYKSVSVLVELSNFQSVRGTLEPQDVPGRKSTP